MVHFTHPAYLSPSSVRNERRHDLVCVVAVGSWIVVVTAHHIHDTIGQVINGAAVGLIERKHAA